MIGYLLLRQVLCQNVTKQIVKQVLFNNNLTI